MEMAKAYIMLMGLLLNYAYAINQVVMTMVLPLPRGSIRNNIMKV